MSATIFRDVKEEVIDADIPGPSKRRVSSKSNGGKDFKCPKCDFIGDSRATTNFHMRQEHPKAEVGRKPRSKAPDLVANEKPLRETTKQLIGTRKKPEITPTSSNSEVYIPTKDNLMEDGYMEVSNEIEINEEVRNEEDHRHHMPPETSSSYVVNLSRNNENKKRSNVKSAPAKKKTPARQKVYDPNNIPFRLRVGDANGKYACYVQECSWKGGYRSLRMDHMRAVHPDWKMPSRYLLQRISKDGVYIDPENYVPPFECQVEGCDWRGNFRASRSAHMKQAHPNYYVENKKKSTMGSYHAEGQYLCHLAECDWRGASRSTRATHMKKEHPHFQTENSRNTVMIECFACGVHVATQFGMLNHIEEYHGLGQHVEKTFDKRSDFLIWVATVERLYSCEFTKRMRPSKDDEHVRYQLGCSCVAQKDAGFITIARNAAYSTMFLKKRGERIMTRRRVTCCLYLDIDEEPPNLETLREGRVLVRGCLEHTGHRWGTPLLRSSVLDRQMFQEFMAYRNAKRTEMPMTLLLDGLADIEGFTIDNLEQTEQHQQPQILDRNSLISLKKIIENDENIRNSIWGSTLCMNIGENVVPNPKFTIGLMSEEMKRLWKSYGCDRVAIVDQASIEISKYTLNVFFVLVLDTMLLPKCACVYITNTTEEVSGHEELLEFLYKVDCRPPRVLVTDPSQIWVEIVAKIWPESDIVMQISEWSILDYWADVAEKEFPHELDRFHVICALRRMLRITDMQQFIYFCVEFFEALHEVNCESFSKFMDYQLSDTLYFKRWSPLHRTDLTSHNNPTLSLACRYFRERFLNPAGLMRVDQYFVVLAKRVEEFNRCFGSETYTLRPLDPVRTVYYPTAVYEERYAKIVGADDAELALPTEEVFTEEIIDYSQMVYDDITTGNEHLRPINHKPQPPHRYVHQNQQRQQEQQRPRVDFKSIVEIDIDEDDEKPSTSAMHQEEVLENIEEVVEQEFDQVEYVEDVVVEEEMQEINESKAANDEEEMIDVVGEPPKKIMKHETTKAVIGQRRPKNRLRLAQSADLSTADRMAIREIASQVIEIDGRKACKRVFLPSSNSEYPADFVDYSEEGQKNENDFERTEEGDVVEHVIVDEVIEEVEESDDNNKPSTSNGEGSSNW